MEDLATEQFKRDFIIKNLIQEEQFEQWLRFTFHINEKLSKEPDIFYQDIFYVKLYQTLTEGLSYAKKVHSSLIKTSNKEKIGWYSKLIDGLNNIKLILDESEIIYIEYRRHCASHIFQNQYEHIQEDLKIKKVRNNKELDVILKQIASLITKHENELNVDKFLNKKLQPELKKLYDTLQITK